MFLVKIPPSIIPLFHAKRASMVDSLITSMSSFGENKNTDKTLGDISWSLRSKISSSIEYVSII